MYIDGKILVGKNSKEELFIVPNKANRHGLITGASGSGKTITLKVMAESFSEMGVPVFLADVKGDIAGTSLPGEASEKINERLNSIGISNFNFKGFPTVFWDIYGKSGHPIRTTVENMGAQIFSRVLGLNETQEGVLTVIFKISKEEGYPLIDLKDLRLLLQKVSENCKEYISEYGTMATQTIGTIQRKVIALEEQGASHFFGEPELDINDLLKTNEAGLGNVNILHAVELVKQPSLYACFLLWLLTTINNTFPEVGDLDKPKMIFFLDEAHLLFNELPTYMLNQVIQIVKLIRSKGVGLYFISQSPNDIPGEILAQLGNKVQHTLRAYTPAEQKGIKAISDSFRTNPEFNTTEAILSLGTGEALISFLNEKGEPNIVERATILPPQSMMGAIDDSMRLLIISRSAFMGKYDVAIDRESAYEMISAENEERKAIAEAERQEKEEQKRIAEELKAEEQAKKAEERAKREEERERKQAEREAKERYKNSFAGKAEKVAGRAANTALNTVVRRATNSLIKGFFK